MGEESNLTSIAPRPSAFPNTSALDRSCWPLMTKGMAMDGELELIVGRTYEGKRKAGVGIFPALVNDRQIKWIGLDEVQYDSPTVAFGRHYPKVTKAAFLKWAKRDVTDELPPGEWREMKR